MGFKEIVFAVSKDKPILLDQLNKSIFSLQEGNIIQDKCEKYFPKDAYLCDL